MAIISKLDSRGNEYWTDDGMPPFEVQRDPLKDQPVADRPTTTGHVDLTLVSVTDASRVAEDYGPQRKDFDLKRDELNGVPLQAVQANPVGKEIAELAGQYDNQAKDLIDSVDNALAPILSNLKASENAVKQLRTNLTSSATQVRLRNREIQRAYQMAVQVKIDTERREQERIQREAAAEENRQRMADLEARRIAAEQEAQSNANPAVAAEAALEGERLTQEATEVAATPAAPVSVSTTAIREAFKIDGQTGVTVYIRTIRDVILFLRWALGQAFAVSIPEGKRNVTVIKLAGIEMTISFAGLRSRDEKLVIPGVAVSKTIDPRSAGRRP